MANLVDDGLDATSAAQAVLIAVAVNTAVKAALVAGVGDRQALRFVFSVLGFAAAAGVVLWAVL